MFVSRSLLGLAALTAAVLLAPAAAAQPKGETDERPAVALTVEFRAGAFGERRAPARVRVEMPPEAARRAEGVRSVAFHATRDPRSPGVEIELEQVRPGAFRGRGVAAPPPSAKAISITMGDGSASFLPLPDETEPGHYPMGPLLGETGLPMPQMGITITVSAGPITITIGTDPRPEPKEPEGGEGTDPDSDSDEDDDRDTDGR